MPRLFKLDIGCGAVKLDGWLGMDAVSLPTVDIVHDFLDFPWPLATASVTEARALHVIEHIPMLCMCCRQQRDPLFAFFDELHRILTPGGTVLIECPHATSLRAWQDPTHRRAISEETFNYVSAQKRRDMQVEHYAIQCDFSVTYGFVTDPHGAIQDIRVTLTKV